MGNNMTELYDEWITAMKYEEYRRDVPRTWLVNVTNCHRNADRLAAYRRKRAERQDTAQRIFWGPW